MQLYGRWTASDVSSEVAAAVSGERRGSSRRLGAWKQLHKQTMLQSRVLWLQQLGKGGSEGGSKVLSAHVGAIAAAAAAATVFEC
jgi:hypothetical protein